MKLTANLFAALLVLLAAQTASDHRPTPKIEGLLRSVDVVRLLIRTREFSRRCRQRLFASLM